MSSTPMTRSPSGVHNPASKNLVLAAMVFAVAMTFIDQTIVAIAIPNIQRELSLSATGSQWVINGYLLALSALFAFGGRLADVFGRRRIVVIGVIGCAVASACCGLTPEGTVAQPWIIFFRVIQGATAALMFPAAVGIVVASFPMRPGVTGQELVQRRGVPPVLLHRLRRRRPDRRARPGPARRSPGRHLGWRHRGRRLLSAGGEARPTCHSAHKWWTS